ncbi:LysE/ArgO family amino acid transporter [Agromyces laixinhei]|uniref:LysE/ArgO family amino acid transporter n=1 Tax=Agromyces laixinhei TaxID=2585717 RepID=UPI0018DE0C75|nr:LysE/ArgO family amino acid transporter [Agromyces laixinhei]
MPVSSALVSPALAGFGLGLSLIVAIGAQNVFVLRQGIRREHVFAVAAICALSDLALIMVGVSGVGVVLAAVPWLVDVIRWAGAAFLVAYGVLAARRALRPNGQALDATAPEPRHGTAPRHDTEPRHGTDSGATTTLTRRHTGTGLAAAVLTCLALTWLNPHVYLDTVFLLGSVANTHGDGRWAFAAGAGVASLVWFFGLAYGARLLGGVLASPSAWRVLDAVIAVVMVGLGVMLVLPR